MDEAIKILQLRLERSVSNKDPAETIAALSSSFKDLTLARFLEELREGKLEVRQWGTAFQIRRSR